MKRPQTLTDIQLVTIVQTIGEQAAFGELVKRHQAPLRAFLCRMTGNVSAAEDIAQEAFIRAYRKIKSFHGKSSFKTWLFAIAYRELLQSGKKQAVQQRVLESAHDMAETYLVDQDPGAGLDLQKALARLSAEERGRCCSVMLLGCPMERRLIRLGRRWDLLKHMSSEAGAKCRNL